jgi:hypothetical protein
MAAIDASQYAEIIIESNDKKKAIDIRLGVVSIDYYEDIFSPTITAKMVVVNTGNTVEGEDGSLQSLYNGLPLRGAERVSLKIEGNTESNPGIDFATLADRYLYVSGISNVVSEGEKEVFTLNLVSREAITNETTRVARKYPSSSPISTSVEDILTKKIQTSRELNIDKTQNKYGFIGNLRKPFTVLTWLASKSVPDISQEDSTAGFVFYQTKDSYDFRSIDSLMTKDSKATYIYKTGASDSPSDQDFNILSYVTNKNQNLLENLRMGTYSSQRIFLNPLTFGLTPQDKSVFSSQNYSGKVKNLGKNIELPPISEGSDVSLADVPTRIMTQILDVGTLDKGVSKDDTNSDPEKYQSQTVMRYNSLFTQTLTMTVPSNTNLKAGDIIECKFPKTTVSTDKREFDEEQSGLYMIKELCHHFDTNGSYTSMKLVRDTFGKSTTI